MFRNGYLDYERKSGYKKSHNIQYPQVKKVPRKELEWLFRPEVVEVDKIVHFVNSKRNMLLRTARIQGELAADEGRIDPYYDYKNVDIQRFRGMLEILVEIDVINDHQMLDIYEEAVSKCDSEFYDWYIERKKDLRNDIPFTEVEDDE